VPGRAPEVVKAEVPLPVAMQASANGLVVWLMNEDLLLRIDRSSGRMTHQWRPHELGDPTWPVRFGQLAVHPDGDLAAVTFWGLGWQKGKEGGRDVVALVEVPGAKAPKDAVPVRRHVVVGNDPRLLGFSLASSSASPGASGTKADMLRSNNGIPQIAKAALEYLEAACNCHAAGSKMHTEGIGCFKSMVCSMAQLVLGHDSLLPMGSRTDITFRANSLTGQEVKTMQLCAWFSTPRFDRDCIALAVNMVAPRCASSLRSMVEGPAKIFKPDTELGKAFSKLSDVGGAKLARV
jgi:hypothetical protein